MICISDDEPETRTGPFPVGSWGLIHLFEETPPLLVIIWFRSVTLHIEGIGIVITRQFRCASTKPDLTPYFGLCWWWRITVGNWLGCNKLSIWFMVSFWRRLSLEGNEVRLYTILLPCSRSKVSVQRGFVCPLDQNCDTYFIRGNEWLGICIRKQFISRCRY